MENKDKNKQKTVLMFPGQGSQYTGMGMDYMALLNKSGNYFEAASELLQEDLIKIISGGNGTSEKLENTFYSQVSIFTLSAAISDYLFKEKYLDRAGIFAVTGHSLGDYGALYACGYFNFKEGFDLVKCRGKLMSEANVKMDGMMAAILGTDYLTLKNLLQEYKTKFKEEVYLANYNDYSQIVISGRREDVGKAIDFLRENGLRKIIPLKVRIASHTPLMKDVSENLGKYFCSLALNDPQVNFYSSTSMIYPKKEEIKSVMEKQLLIPINWVSSIEYFLGNGVNTFIEIGPGRVLSGLVKKIADKNSKDVLIFNTDKLVDLNNLTENLS
ncbi:MAG: ACP S-malonyltransferase [Candidatus Humimicrobiaceae bacterium]